jgi:hypothetical protein
MDVLWVQRILGHPRGFHGDREDVVVEVFEKVHVTRHPRVIERLEVTDVDNLVFEQIVIIVATSGEAEREEADAGRACEPRRDLGESDPRWFGIHERDVPCKLDANGEAGRRAAPPKGNLHIIAPSGHGCAPPNEAHGGSRPPRRSGSG